MKCEFEEKTYEQFHNLELLNENKIFFPPGQAQEKYFGVDAFLFSKNRKFWKLWLNPPLENKLLWPCDMSIPQGVYLENLYWESYKDIIDRELEAKFKFNIFIQYKRPDYLKTERAKEFSFWNKPYYRYYIQFHQQQILSKIEKQVNNKAVVVYAAPAFHTFDKLFQYYSEAKLIENSNYVKPSTLDNHQRWTYTNSGTFGIAFSEPEKIENIKLTNYLNLVKKHTKESLIENNSEFITKTSNILVDSINKTEHLSKVFNKIVEQIIFPEHPFGKALLMIYLILFLTKISWGIYYE